MGDAGTALRRDPFRKRIEEGLASPDAGDLTRARISELVEEGIARAIKEGLSSPASITR
jgi:hypothetical protein